MSNQIVKALKKHGRGLGKTSRIQYSHPFARG